MKGVVLRIGSGKDIEISEAPSGVTVEGRDVSLYCEEYPDSPNRSFLLTPPREYHFKATPQGPPSRESFSFRVYCYDDKAGVFLGNWVKVKFDPPEPPKKLSRWDLLDQE